MMRRHHLLPPGFAWLVLLVLLLSPGCRTVNNDNSSVKFYGADNQSGEIRFEAYIDVALKKGISTQDDLFSEPAKSQVIALITRQIQHLYASFSVHEEFADTPGIIEAKGTPQLLKADLDLRKGSARVFYSYKDRVVFKNKIFKSPKITFLMPRDPVTIYTRTLNSKGFNPCTDEHYNTEEDFWYFWNPKNEGCKIPKSELESVTAKLVPTPNTKKSYPDYDKILGDNGNGRIVDVTFLVGVDENFRNGDLGKKAYKDVTELLDTNGFQVESVDSRHNLLTLRRGAYDVRIDLYLVDPDSKKFMELAANGLENSDVFLYDGHSGLGSYLNLPRFREILGRPLKLPIGKSQIFYFNGCSTFPYYNADYFDLKRTAKDPNGSRNLDIITTSVGATFDVGAGHDAAFLTGLFLGKKPTWQSILNDIYRVDPAESTLTHVNGDEDNPTSIE